MSKRVLITGGCGFIGRNVARELLRHGHDVRIVDSLVEQVHGSRRRPERIAEAEYMFGDIRDSRLAARAIKGMDSLVHLAAEVGVGQSMYEIARYVGGNDLGTAVLLEAAIESEVERIVVASSMSVYGEGLYRDGAGGLRDDVRRKWKSAGPGNWDPAGPEGEPLAPLPTPETKPVDLASIYALTKYAQEKQVLIFAGAYGRKAVALRLFNVFGPGQALSNPYTGVLANFSSRIANGHRPLVFEDGRQRRDFVHVRDVAKAFRLALERTPGDGEVVNVGSGRSYTIAEVATGIAEAMGAGDLPPEVLQSARSGDIRHCFADISKARALLGFEPEHLLEDSFQEMAEWVRKAGAEDRAAEMRRQLEERGLVS
ncbi:MAG: NAD-dependent epimerase/dehydratase family protein [Nitratireductor sp.]|nr:NAD-dependent epimerase/dehydratase family protein [Nitratireductor sp.]